METLTALLAWLTALLGEDHEAIAPIAALTELDGITGETAPADALPHLEGSALTALGDALRAASGDDEVSTEDLISIAEACEWLDATVEAQELAEAEDAEAREALRRRIAGEVDDTEGDDGGSDDEGDDGDGGVEPAADAENEDVLVAGGAAARRTPAARVAAARGRRAAAPAEPEVPTTLPFTHLRQTAQIGRGAELATLTAGAATQETLGHAVGDALRDIDGIRGPVPKEYVARCDYLDRVDESRRLREGQHAENAAKVQAAINSKRLRPRTSDGAGDALSALVAAGGLCAPLMPFYPLFELGNADRPARDALPGFVLDRGGVQVPVPPSFADGDYDGGTAVWTAANDESPDDPTVKPFLELDCQDFIDVEMYAVTRGVLVPNFRQRSWPEQVDNYLHGADLVHARAAETELITAPEQAGQGINAGIDYFSTLVPVASSVYGIARDVLFEIDLKGTVLRDVHRMDPTETLDVWLPSWFRAAIRSDIAQQSPGDGLGALSVADSMIDGWFRDRNIRVVWFRDTQNYTKFTAGQDKEWHASVKWYMHPTGSFLFGDGGTLDVGVFRDKDMVELNQYAIFDETFEALIPIGVRTAMIKCSQPVCVNGAAAGLVDPDDCRTS